MCGVRRSRDSHGILTVVCGVGHSSDSHGSLWGWALQGFSGLGVGHPGFSRQSVGLGTPGMLTVVCGVGHVGLGTPESLTRFSRWSVGLGTPGIVTAVCGVGHSRDSHGSLWGWAVQGFSQHWARDSHGSLWGWAGFSRQSAGLGTVGILTAVCGVGHSRDSRGWAL